MSISLNPIISPILLLLFGGTIMALTVWVYLRKMRTGQGAWRWVALTLRLIAVVMCLLAALRPSVNIPEKKPQNAAILMLIDTSASQKIRDEVGARSRWEVARSSLEAARKAVANHGTNLEVHEYQFDTDLREGTVDDKTQPEGRETAIGSMLMEAVKKNSGTPIASILLISDGANNGGIPPLVAAESLKRQLIPVMTVGVGSENAGGESRDIAIRDFVAGPTVFVKNRPEIRATLSVRGFANVPLEVELYVEGEPGVVDRTTVTATDPNAIVPVTGLKYVPTLPGEKRITLKVKPRDGELVVSNNEFSTYLNVLKGGLRVLYVQGENHSWDPRFLIRSLDAAKEINVDYKVLRQPASGDQGLLGDEEFAVGAYDVYIIGDLPADHLTLKQQRALADLIDQKGTGMIMLGGRSTFGPGGWGNSPLARVMPVNVSANDGQFEPDGGFKVIPNDRGLESYMLRLAPTKPESAQAWARLPNITGTNLFLGPKPNAILLASADTPNHEPVMLAMETGRGRVIAFGGETWPWRRESDAGLLAHLRFWRQSILWLAHKEDQGDQEIKLKLDARRIALGQKLDFTATARDAKKEPISGVNYTSTVTFLGPDGKAEPVNLFPQGNEGKGTYFATGKAGEYRVDVSGTKDGTEIGSDSSRFMVYQDDRELENPAADRSLLKQIAEITGGKSLQPEELAKELAALDTGNTDRVSLTEHRIWDNWPFFLIFTCVLTLEWWLRKSRGWV